MIVAPSTVSDDQRALVATWIRGLVRGDEMRNFDLRAEIARRGMTHPEFAARVGVSDRLVRYWLRGERMPTAEMARRIAAALGLHPSYVVTRFVIRKETAPPRAEHYDPRLPLVGRNLAAARVICKLTQKQLSAITSVSLADISSCESASRPPATGLALQEVQRAIANRLRRRGYRTATKVNRPPRVKDTNVNSVD